MASSDEVEAFQEFVSIPNAESVKKILDGLSEDERIILNQRYGLEDGRLHSDQAIADQLNITITELNAIHDSALEKIRSQATVVKVPISKQATAAAERLLKELFSDKE